MSEPLHTLFVLFIMGPGAEDAFQVGVYLLSSLAVGLQQVEAIGKERHVGMVAADTAFLLAHSHEDLQTGTLLQAAQADPDAILVVGT